MTTQTMKQQGEQEGIFVQSQEQLTEDVYNAILYKPKLVRIRQEMSKFIEGLK